MPPRVFTEEELADYLRMPRETLKYWRRKGRGPNWFMAGRYPRYREEAVAAWMQEQEAQARSA